MEAVQSYRDVPLSFFSSSDDWNIIDVPPIGDGGMDMYDEGSNESGGGFQFSFLSHRFLLWRIQSNEIELVEYSSQDNLTNNRLRLRFSSILVANVCFTEDFSSGVPALFFFVATSDNILYRFSLTHPSSIDRKATSTLPSVLATHRIVDRMIITGNVAAKTPIQCMECVSAKSVALGSSNGSIYITTVHQDSRLDEVELKTSGRMAKLWQSMTTAEGSAQSIQSLAVQTLSNQNVILSVSGDKLRIWSTSNDGIIQSLDIPNNEEGITPCKLEIKAINLSSSSFLAVLRLDFEEEDQVRQSEFYMFKFQKNQLSYLYQTAAPEIEVIDFYFSKHLLWVTGIHPNGSYLTQNIELVHNHDRSLTCVDTWQSVFLQHLHSLKGDIVSSRCLDVADFYMGRILASPRFTEKMIADALAELYPEISLNSSSIKSTLYEALHDLDSLEDEATRWKRLLDCCDQHWKRSAFPFGLFVSPSGFVCVIAQSSCSIIRPCSILEEIHRTFAYNEFSMKQSLSQPSLLQQDGFLELFECANILLSAYEPGQLSLLDEELLHVQDVGSSFNQSIHSLYALTQSAETQIILDDVFHRYNMISRPLDLIQTFIAFCVQFSSEESFPPPAASLVTPMSDFFKHILSICFIQSSQSLYVVLRNVTLLVFFLARSKPVLAFSTADSAQIHSELIPSLLQFTSKACTLHWLSTQRVEAISLQQNENSSHSLATRFSTSLSMKDHTLPLLIQTYIPNSLRSECKRNEEENEEKSLYRWLNLDAYLMQITRKILTSYTKLESNEAGPNSSVEDFSCFLDSTAQYETLHTFLRLQHQRSNKSSFYQGKVYLQWRQLEKAEDCFMNASQSLEWEAYSQYCVEMSELFQNYAPNRQTIAFLQRAIQSKERGLEHCSVAGLWSRIFNVSISQADYQCAYNAMLYSGEYQEKHVAQLVKELCEENRTDLLCFHEDYAFPWSGMVTKSDGTRLALVDLVDTVLQKESKEKSDVLSYPNYYQILFSFHSHRGNYMKAGKAMTDYARRLHFCSEQQIDYVDRLKKKTQCYLAALNSFRLVDDDYAWGEFPANYLAPTFPPVHSKRMRDGDFNFSDTKTFPSPPPRICRSLQELKKMYVVTSAQLTLARAGVPRPGEKDMDVLISLVNNNYLKRAIILASLTEPKTQRSGMIKVFQKFVGTILLASEQTPSMWNELKDYLEKYDLTKNRSYYLAVAGEILKKDTMHIPNWISVQLHDNAGAYLHLLLSHRRYEEAADVILCLLTSSNNTHTGQIWLPYTQIDQLLDITKGRELTWKEKRGEIQNLFDCHSERLCVGENMEEDTYIENTGIHF